MRKGGKTEKTVQGLYGPAQKVWATHVIGKASAIKTESKIPKIGASRQSSLLQRDVSKT